MRLATLIEQFEPALLAQYGERLLPGAHRALAALGHCRDPEGPCLLARCPHCQDQAFIPHSCGHRSCPHCQHHESATWLERQRERRLPVDYFMVTFSATAPALLYLLHPCSRPCRASCAPWPGPISA